MTKIDISNRIGSVGICAVIDSDGNILPCMSVDNEDETSTLKVLICGVQSDGTITPVLVDSDGKIIMV